MDDTNVTETNLRLMQVTENTYNELVDIAVNLTKSQGYEEDSPDFDTAVAARVATMVSNVAASISMNLALKLCGVLDLDSEGNVFTVTKTLIDTMASDMQDRINKVIKGDIEVMASNDVKETLPSLKVKPKN